MAETPKTLDDLMVAFSWAVHDFQRFANTLSLLVSSLHPSEEWDAPSFYADIDALVMPEPMSAAERRTAGLLSDEDRAALRRLKSTRDNLVYNFFVEHRIEKGKSVPEKAWACIEQAQKDVAAATVVLNRLYADLAAQDV